MYWIFFGCMFLAIISFLSSKLSLYVKIGTIFTLICLYIVFIYVNCILSSIIKPELVKEKQPQGIILIK